MFDVIRIMLRKRREYRRNAAMSADAYAAMKLAKFRALVAHANAHSPYYQDIIRERGIDVATCTPADFPVLTKAGLMANFDAIATDRRVTRQAVADFLSRSTNPEERFLGEFRVIHTSGSSGEMGYFVYSPTDWARGMAQGMRPPPDGATAFNRKKRQHRGRIRVAYYAAVGGHFAGVTMCAGMTSGLARFFIDARMFEVNEPMAGTVTRLNALQPELLMGYTGALLLLARQQQAGHLKIRPQVIATGGEGLSATERATLESAFGGIATNGYGTSEHLMMGTELRDTGSMLLFDDELIYEMQPDCTWVSNLFNYTLPLIRYRMADVLTPVKTKSHPGLPYPEIGALIGRTEAMPVFVNAQGMEDSIHPITIAEIFVAGVQRFQLRRLGNDRFTFLVVLDPGLDAAGKAKAVVETEQRLRELLAQKQLENVQFSVQVVDELAVNPRTRKFQLIVNQADS